MDALAPVVARMAGTLSTEHGPPSPGPATSPSSTPWPPQALAGVTVGPVASRTPARAAERAAQVGGRAVTYDELPAGADVVLVATPPARHASDALAALAAGAAVIVEKPLATTLAEADALVEAAAADGGTGWATPRTWPSPRS